MRHTTLNTIVGRFALAALLAGSVLTSAATKGPDGGGYTATDATVYSFIDIAGSGGTSVLNGVDDGLAPLTLPFSFPFYGQSYSVACVSSNGALYFVVSAAACSGFNDFANTDLSSTNTPNDLPAILPLWSDLTFDVQGAGAVYYRTMGAAGSRKFVVQWNNAYPQGAPNPVTFQAVLLEANNTILFQYQTIDAGGAAPVGNGGAATIGIRNSGALATQEQLEWSFGAPVLSNSTALLFAGTSGSLTARMRGDGELEAAGVKYKFAFEIQNRTDNQKNRLTLELDRPRQPHSLFEASTIVQITFSNDPAVQPGKGPKAVADTLTCNGMGRWNNAPGYTFTLQAVDKGEPGKSSDTVAITIFSPTGQVIATVNGAITGGSIQAESSRSIS